MTAKIEEVSGEELFQRTLAGELWTEHSFNAKPCETQELSKNLFLFMFSLRKDLEKICSCSGSLREKILNQFYGTVLGASTDICWC